MTIDYARAYAKERMAHANNKRLQREAIHTHKAMSTTGGRARARIGRQLVSIGRESFDSPSPGVFTRDRCSKEIAIDQ